MNTKSADGNASDKNLSPCELVLKMLFGPSDQEFSPLEWELIDSYLMRKDPKTLGDKMQDHIATLEPEDFGALVAQRLTRVVAIQKNRGTKIKKTRKVTTKK